MLKRAAFPLLGLLLATLAGCASSRQSTGGTPAYVDGTWTGSTTRGASTMLVVLKQTGSNVTGTLSGAGATVDGPIEGTVDSNSIQLKQRTTFGQTPLLRASCEEISGDLGGTVVKLTRAIPYTVDGTWVGDTTKGAKMVVVLKQTGSNVTGTLSGAGTVDGLIEGTVQGKTIQLRERSGFRQTPMLNVSCEQISGPLHDGTTVTLRRIP